MYWVRKKKKKMMGFGIVTSFALVATVFYWIAGGPEKSVDLVKDIVWFYTR